MCASCTFRFVLVQIKVHALATSGTQPEEYMVEEADDLSKAAYLNQALREQGQNFSGEKEGVQDQDLQEAVCCISTACVTFLLSVVCVQAIAWMAERTDDEVMAQREATMLAIEQFAAELEISGQKLAWL